MRNLITIPLLLFMALYLGCTYHPPKEFMKTVNSVEPGTPQIRVLEQLGRPDSKSDGLTTVSLRRDPSAAGELARDVPAGTRYQEWVYERGDSDFHVMFVPTPGRPGWWEVVEVRSTPSAKK